VAHHRFTPRNYYSTFGQHDPVLAVEDGDTVHTTTVDSSGFDEADHRVATTRNPLTGPFCVVGAEPGDALEIRFLEILPNRSTAYSSRTLSPQVVEPTSLVDLPPRTSDRSERAPWHLDHQRSACSSEAIDGGASVIVVPMKPMIGCVGVAPPGGEALGTWTAGRHGGNMDYNRLVAGCALYLPVFVSGGLLLLGDGHAAQGEGEPAGTGIEVSMDVRFSIHLHRGGAPAWPRGQDAHDVFTIGSARPLEHAVQYATTEMVRWLTSGFGLDLATACLVIGQSARYDVANVHNPAYSVACRVRRSLIEGMARS